MVTQLVTNQLENDDELNAALDEMSSREATVAAKKAAPHVRLVGYRELIALAQQKRAMLSSTGSVEVV